MNLVFLGPPGSGKGTQAKKLSSTYKWPQLSTGDMLRAAISNRTPIGIEAERYMQHGQLVPDELVIGIIQDRIRQQDCSAGFILDGFPRTVPQAQALDRMLSDLNRSVDSALLFDIKDEVLVGRLTGRRTCLKCGAMYHVQTLPPKKAGVCDNCSSQLVQREDDNENVIRKRLQIYHEMTAPVAQYYSKNAKLKTLDASLDSARVNALVVETVAASLH